MTTLLTIPEETTSYITVTFLDKDGAAAAPASATWEAIDVDTGTVMKTSTAITPIAASVEITIPPAVNVIVDESKRLEMRRIIVKASYGASDKVNDQYDYLIKNVSQV